MFEKTLNFILPGNSARIIPVSRTDAMVSSMESLATLILGIPVEPDFLKKQLNLNLPADIKILEVKKARAGIDLINHPKQKTYRYHFTIDQKFHPFLAPFLTNFKGPIDREKMKQAALMIEGSHDFGQLCFRPRPNQKTVRKVEKCHIESSQMMLEKLIEQEIDFLEIQASGFLHYQVRMIMGTLVQIGRNEIQLDDLAQILEGRPPGVKLLKASASGLMLYRVELMQQGDIYSDD